VPTAAVGAAAVSTGEAAAAAAALASNGAADPQQQQQAPQQGKDSEGLGSQAGGKTAQLQQLREEEGRQQQQKEQAERQGHVLQQVQGLAGTHYSSWGQEAWAAVLAYEDALRLSPETQAAYEAAEQHSSSNDWLDVTEGLQRRVLAEAGLSSSQMTAGLATMRGAPNRCVLPSLMPLSHHGVLLSVAISLRATSPQEQ
jgi:hypothetical protein